MISIMGWEFKKAAVVTCSSHLVFIENKTVYDTWDCRTRKIYNYYVSHNIPGLE